MEKFGMSFGGGPSRKELLDAVELQKKQLVQYQSRFKDLVRAYKSLLKEKEALESSLRALTAAPDHDQEDHDHDQDQDRYAGNAGHDIAAAAASPELLPDDGFSLHSEDSEDTPTEPRGDQSEDELGGQTAAAESEAESGGAVMGAEPQQQQATPPPGATPPPEERRLLQLRGQLSTLTVAIATVTQEKSRMEAGFQADKRQLKQEVEELRERLVAVETQQEEELRGVRQQLAESRARVITQQHERQQEQSDHATQLHELQRLLQQQRDRLQHANNTITVTTQAADRGAEAEAELGRLREERDELRTKLLIAEQNLNKPDPRVDELQRELVQMKNQFQDQTHIETRKAVELEERARERAAAAESRAAGLEQRVSELSELLGAAEKNRQRDQTTAQRLRDRVLQLDTENKTLAIAATGRTGRDRDLDVDLDVSALKEKMEKLTKLLQLKNQNQNQDQSIQQLLQTEPLPGDTATLPGDDTVATAALQQELRQLKDEFERYKLRAQVVLKNKNARDGCQATQLEEQRAQLSELKEKYITLRIHGDEAEARHARELEERAAAAAALQQTARREALAAAATHRDELLRLEAELHKQRERTMALLQEKDGELERLRSANANLAANASANAADQGDEDEPRPDSEGDAVTVALRRVAVAEPTLLLYGEQLARKEAELAALRRHKHALEEEARRLRSRLAADGARHGDEEAELRQRLEKLSRDRSREGANMEYLKNVVYKFLTLPDGGGRQHALNAVLTVLHFSPAERQGVMRLQGAGPAAWWTNQR